MADDDLTGDLRALLERPGPHVSVYLNTEAGTDEGREEVALRWRAIREKAAGAGASDDALEALDAVVDRAHQRADGLVAFASGGELALRRHLPTAIDDAVRVGPLPHLLPLLDWRQENPRAAVAVCDRKGADLYVVNGDVIEEAVTVEGEHDEIRKVNPGGWSQRRFQQRAEESWEANAKQAAKELGTMHSRENIELVVLAGDVRAVQFVKEHLDEHIEPVVELQVQPVTALDEIKVELDQAAAAFAGRTTDELLQKFYEERGQKDLAVEGASATLGAMRMSQVGTLIVTPEIADRPAWFSASQPSQADVEKGPLADSGLNDLEQADLTDVLIAAALSTGASVRVTPQLPDDKSPAEGVGGLLRFTT